MQKKQKAITLFLILVIGSTSLFAENIPKLSAKKQRLFDYYFYEAMRTKNIEKYGETIDFLNYCEQIDSTNANVNYELGNFYSLLQNVDKTLDFYRKAVKYDKDNLYYNMALGSVCLDSKKYSEAIPIYEQLVKSNPQRNDLYLYLSEAYRLNGDLPNAIKALNELETQVGLNEKISLQKFQLYNAIGQKEKAYAEVQKYVDKYPENPRYCVLLANLYVQDNKNKQAMILFNKAKALDPENTYLITSLANYYQQIGNKQAAKEELYAALFSSKADIDMKMDILGQYVNILQQNKKETTAANSLLDTLILRYPQEPRLNLMYGNLLLSQKNIKDARYELEIYTEATPNDPTGWEQLLRTSFPDSLDLSIKICEKAITYLPKEAVFYLYLGNSQYMKNDCETSMKTFKKGLEMVKDNPFLESQFYGQLGDIYQQIGKSDSAFVQYQKALVSYPQNIPVMNNYSYYLSLQKKDLTKAEQMSSYTVKAEPTNPTYLDTYGWVLFQEGAYVTAKIYIENAIKYSEHPAIDPNDPNATPPDSLEISSEMFQHYGDVLYKTDEKEKALEYWIKARDKAEKEKKGSASDLLKKKIETKTYFAE